MLESFRVVGSGRHCREDENKKREESREKYTMFIGALRDLIYPVGTNRAQHVWSPGLVHLNLGNL